MLELASTEATVGVVELEWPEEVGSLLEVGAHGEDLVDQILHTDNAVLAKVVLDQLVVGQGDALLVDLAVTTLVDKLTDGLQVGVTICDVGVDNGQHLLGGLGELDEDAIVDLKETEQLENLARLGCDLADTLDADHEDELGLLLNVESTVLARETGEADLLTLCIAVLLDVGLGALEDSLALLLVGLASKVSL